jgi:lipopolysaccharide biosynthesis glycosyltransferase
MNKNVLLTISIGYHNNMSETFLAMENYCKKYNIDFIRINYPIINFISPYFEKFFFIDLLDRYDRVLYMDADVLITPNAVNIFDYYPDTTKFYAYNETDNNETMDRDEYVKPLLTDMPNWPMDDKNKYRYFNSGVMLISKEHKDFFKNFKNIPEIPGIFAFQDQTYLNYLIVKHNIKYEYLDYSFNRMHLGNKDENHDRYNSNFIHYAGPDVYGDGNKNITIINDYKKLYLK